MQLDELPHAGERERGPDEAGRQRARVGGDGRHRRLRRSIRPQRGRHARRRRVLAGQGPPSQRTWCRGGDRPSRRGVPLLARRAHAGRVGVAALRQAGARVDRRRPRHRLRASRPPDDGRVDLHVQARRHGSDVRGDVGLHGRVRQPPLLDEAEAPDRQPLRQLRRGVGGEPPHRPGSHPAAAVGRPSPHRRRRGRPLRPPQRPRGQDRRPLPRATRGARHRRSREAPAHRRGPHYRCSGRARRVLRISSSRFASSVSLSSTSATHDLGRDREAPSLGEGRWSWRHACDTGGA